MSYDHIAEVQPCMGGWCGRRESCPNYLTHSDAEPAERLCGPVEGQARPRVQLLAVEPGKEPK